ncbi:MAG: alpha/beta hydrolase family protein [Planctomycetota bacterium]|jgi:dipeptidyl aminopeptidase/acylaminoacyl peptidase
MTGTLNFMKTKRITICLLALTGLLSVVEADEVMTEMTVAKIRSVGSISISPDGRQIAYTLSVPRPVYTDDDGGAWSELHVVDRTGRSRPFITGKVNVSSIKWTPDGKGISFLAKRGQDKHKALYVIAADGGEARKVLEHETDIGGYSWSPDGKEVAFTAKPKQNKQIEDGKEHGFDAQIYEEDYLMTKVWIAAVDSDDPGPDRDEQNKPRMLPLEGSASTIAWNPDGKHLAVALAPTPLVDDSYMFRRIHIVDAAGGKSLLQLDTEGKLGQIEWSPDGKHLALVAGVDKHDPREGHLMVTSVGGSKTTDLLPDYPGHIWSVAWRDNDTITYLGFQGVWTTLAEINIDGSGRETLLPVGKFTLSGLSLSADGLSAAFVGDSPKHPREVFAFRHGNKRPRRLTHSNPDLENIRLARQQVVTFKARDGLELEGILVHPLDRKRGKRYPLIMMVHGGPESHHLNGWLTRYSLPSQVAAAQGFACFYTNYRGGTGRGVAFSKLSQADPAGKEFDDLVDAVDHLVDIGLVDKDRVGITGGSYGGYASAWGATYYTDRYAASVMFVGISDQFLSFALGDIPEEHRLVHHMKYPWEDMELMRQRSPITHFEKCRTPLLILHGTSDTRVHPAQSLALYRAVKTYGKTPVRLVRYPGEPHGNRRTGSRLDFSLRLMRWMNHYLKGPGGDPPAYALDLSQIKPEEKKNADDSSQ